MHFAVLRLGVFYFFFSHGGVHMGQMDFISSIFFFKIIWEEFHWSHVTDVKADQSPLFVHSTPILKQWRHSDQHVPFGHVVFTQKHFGTCIAISDQALM